MIAMPKIVYLWWSVAGLLLLAEMLVPGASLLWLGLAALATGVVLMVWPLLSALLQALVFGGFAVVGWPSTCAISACANQKPTARY